MAQRTERADALRNREAVLAAADALFAASSSPHSVSMDDIAAAAGVGKGTLFRRFGDRRRPICAAVIASRLDPLQRAVREAQDAAGSSPRQRVLDLLDVSLRFKIENRNLMTAAEDAGLSRPGRALRLVARKSSVRHWNRCPASTTRISPPTPCWPPSAPTSWRT